MSDEQLHLDVADLVDRYDERDYHGPGLIHLLAAELGERARRSDSDGRGSGKPGPRINLNLDASELLADITAGVDDHRVRAGLGRLGHQRACWRIQPHDHLGYPLAYRYGRPVRKLDCQPVEHLIAALRTLPDIATPDTARRITDDIHEWRRLARLTLGFQIPSVGLPDVVCGKHVLTPAGWTTIGCGQPTLRVARDANSAVWCSNQACHDPQQQQQYSCSYDQVAQRWDCRRTDRDLRHAIRWTNDEWAHLPQLEEASTAS